MPDQDQCSNHQEDRFKLRIAVVIAAYDASVTIAGTLDAVQAQTHAPSQVVVVVDGPDSNTERIARDHPVVTNVIALPENRGSSAARNRGWESVRGDVDAVHFLDADDLPAPLFLASCADLLVRKPDICLAATWFTNFPAGEPEPRMDEYLGDGVRSEGAATDIDATRYFGRPGSLLLSFTLVRSSALDEIRPGGVLFVEELRNNMDFELLTRLLTTGTGAYLETPGGAYRVIPTSLSADGTRAWRGRVAACELLLGWARETGRNELANTLRSAKGSAVRHTARHEWVKGEKVQATRTLLKDSIYRCSPMSFLLLVMLPMGLDGVVRGMSRGDQRTG
jgi:hypothetical protein